MLILLFKFVLSKFSQMNLRALSGIHVLRYYNLNFIV